MALIYGEEPGDDLLYEQYLRGDTASYDALMVRYGDRLVCYLNGYLHDWQEAEDLMIEAFARIMVKRPRIGAGAFRAYLFRTARNLALRSRERKRRVQMFSVDGMEREIADNILAAGVGMSAGFTNSGSAGSTGGSGSTAPEGTGADAAGGTFSIAPDSPIEEDLTRQELKLVLHQCLDRLEPELREALWLVYFEELTYAQAASVMGVKEKRIDRLLVRGRQQMRKELRKEGVTNAYE